MPKNMLIPDFVQKVKVASHKYLELQDPVHYRFFAWQSGYGAFSVSPSIVDNVMRYIKNQPEHHRKHTFEEEYLRFLSEYKVEESDERYIFCD
jgi:putative transposase